MTFGLLAVVAPCPWMPRSDATHLPAARVSGQALEGVGEHPMTHSGHLAGATDVTPSEEACPYDLMHALYGVLKPAPASTRPATLTRALVVAVTNPSLIASAAVLEYTDPPPRSN